MAASKLDTLQSDFRAKVELVLAECTRCGVHMVPYFCVRSPREQAKLWRQSRTTLQINKQIALFRNMGAPYLADCIEQAGPQNGPEVTNAPPGLSWHNWGQAVDCFLKSPDGTANWNGDHPGYATYAEVAKSYGLTAGYFWKNHPGDKVHIQGPAFEVLEQTTYPEIDENMRRRFGA